jgi:hypothetical protein
MVDRLSEGNHGIISMGMRDPSIGKNFSKLLYIKKTMVVFKVLRGIILLPVAVILITLLNNYEDSEMKHIDTQSTTEDVRRGI